MKILALQGSPRLKGNTQAVLDIVLAAASEAGAEVETIQLSKLDNLTGCKECFACQKQTGEPGCVVDDDMQTVHGKALKADVIVWATPVFCWSPTWLLKMAMDRFYCMFKFDDGGGTVCLLEGRKMAAVITAGGDEKDGADLVGETCRRLAEFSKCKWLSAFVSTHVKTPKAINADAKLVGRACTFGRQLVS